MNYHIIFGVKTDGVKREQAYAYVFCWRFAVVVVVVVAVD